MKRKRSNNIYDEMVTIDHVYKMWDIVKKTCNNRMNWTPFSGH